MIKPRLSSPIVGAVLIQALVLAALLNTACSSPEQTRRKTVAGAFTGVNAARDGFVAWDLARQDQIIEEAKSISDGEAKLKNYREHRHMVELAFEVAYRGLALAALEPTVDNLGKALTGVNQLYNLIQGLTGKKLGP